MENVIRRNKALVFFLLTMPLSSFAGEPDQAAPSRPYYDCMKLEAGKYSKKADQISDAILAASATCEHERKKLMAYVAAELIYKKRMSGDEAMEVARLAVADVDNKMRPSLIKAVLDSR